MKNIVSRLFPGKKAETEAEKVAAPETLIAAKADSTTMTMAKEKEK